MSDEEPRAVISDHTNRTTVEIEFRPSLDRVTGDVNNAGSIAQQSGSHMAPARQATGLPVQENGGHRRQGATEESPPVISLNTIPKLYFPRSSNSRGSPPLKPESPPHTTRRKNHRVGHSRGGRVRRRRRPRISSHFTNRGDSGSSDSEELGDRRSSRKSSKSSLSKDDGNVSSRSSSSSGRTSGTNIIERRRERRKMRYGYDYECLEPSFFAPLADTTIREQVTVGGSLGSELDPTLAQHLEFSGPTEVVGIPTSSSFSKKPEAGGVGETMNEAARISGGPSAWQLNFRLEKYALMEIAWGMHQMVELSASDILKRVRMHRYIGAKTMMAKKKNVPELTYRDIRQVFSTQAQPSLEIRSHCLLVCLPPLTAFVFHDRCVFQLNESLETDSLLGRLEEITAHYSLRHEETEEWFLRKANSPPTCIRDRSTNMSTMRKKKSMLFSLEEQNEAATHAQNTPRFVQFPLEFALLEILISHAFESLNTDLEDLEDRADKVYKRSLKRRQPRSNRIEELHQLREPVDAFLDNVSSLSKAFQEILANHEDMFYMELTRNFFDPNASYSGDAQQLNPHLEVLLEFFDQELDQFESRSRKLCRGLDNAERHINLKMALIRNDLHFWELTCTLLTVGLGAGSCLSGLFGMNLKNYFETNAYMFWSMGLVILTFILVSISLVLLLRLKYN